MIPYSQMRTTDRPLISAMNTALSRFKKKTDEVQALMEKEKVNMAAESSYNQDSNNDRTESDKDKDDDDEEAKSDKEYDGVNFLKTSP
jgi:Sec-independent protein translocase protein TatA